MTSWRNALPRGSPRRGRHRGSRRFPPPWKRKPARGRRGLSALHVVAGIVATGSVSALVLASIVPGPSRSTPDPQPFQAAFPEDTKLVTNELAYREPRTDGAHVSQDWLVTSGSLFARDGAGWTGEPDSESPDADSSNGTGSAVFRAVTRQHDFTDVGVHFQLRIDNFVTTDDTPAKDYDGVHVFLRYQNERHLYAVSVSRRDGTVVVKKKTPGGPSNGGSYVALAQVDYDFPRDEWVSVDTGVATRDDGSVRIRLALDGQRILEAIDDGAGGEPPIRSAGRVGLRGDNCEFTFRGFVVRPREVAPST